MRLDERSVVSRVDRVNVKELRVWVRAGWVRPVHGENGPVFDEVDIARIRLLCEMKKDMKLSTETFAIVLPLLDRLHQTRRELRAVTEVLDEEPEEVRQRVAKRVRERIGPAEDNDKTRQD